MSDIKKPDDLKAWLHIPVVKARSRTFVIHGDVEIDGMFWFVKQTYTMNQGDGKRELIAVEFVRSDQIRG